MPLDFEGKREAFSGGHEVDFLLVACVWLGDLGTGRLAIYGIPACGENSKYWFVQHVLAESLVHFAGREVA